MKRQTKCVIERRLKEKGITQLPPFFMVELKPCFRFAQIHEQVCLKLHVEKMLHRQTDTLNRARLHIAFHPKRRKTEQEGARQRVVDGIFNIEKNKRPGKIG